MNCIYLKQKLNYKFECKRNKQEICLKNCSNCPYKEYKMQQCILDKNKTQKNRKISFKQKSSKLAKLERNRFSLFTDDLEHCIICNKKKKHMHEIFCGRNRQNSMRYGLCLPICELCHNKYQNDAVFNLKWHKKGQAMFNKTYPNLKFEDIFKKNYL